jgi:hypothetical protein
MIALRRSQLGNELIRGRSQIAINTHTQPPVPAHDAVTMMWVVIVVVVLVAVTIAAYCMVMPVFDWPRHSIGHGG